MRKLWAGGRVEGAGVTVKRVSWCEADITVKSGRLHLKSVIVSLLWRQSHRQVVIIISEPVPVTVNHNSLCLQRERNQEIARYLSEA